MALVRVDIGQKFFFACQNRNHHPKAGYIGRILEFTKIFLGLKKINFGVKN